MLKIKDMNLNNVIRQGDSQPREYQLDTGNLDLNLTNKSATIRLMTADFQGIGYETTATVSSENKISFSIDDVIPAREYRLEITVDDYVFPSRATDGRFDIDPSSHGQEVNIIQVIGKDEIVREVKEQIEPFLGYIEQAELDRQAQEEARETAEGERQEEYQKYGQQFTDVITELSEEKDYHSLPEIAGARGGFDTLGDRLDETTAQLAQIALNVRSFGAVGDGIANDTTKFVDAINLLSQKGGGTLAVPTGNYLIDPDVVQLKSNVNIIGTGKSRIFTKHGEPYEFMLGNHTETVKNVEISGLEFDQFHEIGLFEPITNTLPTRMISIYEPIDVHINKNHFNNLFGQHAISSGYWINSEGNYIKDNRVTCNRFLPETSEIYDASAIYVDDKYHEISNNIIESIDTGYHWWKVPGAIEVHGAAGFVKDNVITDAYIGLNLCGDPQLNRTNNPHYVVSGNKFDRVHKGVSFWTAETLRDVENVHIFQNTINIDVVFTSKGNNAIGFEPYTARGNLRNVVISDNIINGQKSYANYTGSRLLSTAEDFSAFNLNKLDGTVEDVKIHNNIITNYGGGILSTARNTNAPNKVKNVQFKDNHIVNPLRFPFTGTYFGLYDIADGEEITITNNNLVFTDDAEIPENVPEVYLLNIGDNVKKLTYLNNQQVEGNVAIGRVNISDIHKSDLQIDVGLYKRVSGGRITNVLTTQVPTKGTYYIDDVLNYVGVPYNAGYRGKICSKKGTSGSNINTATKQYTYQFSSYGKYRLEDIINFNGTTITIIGKNGNSYYVDNILPSGSEVPINYKAPVFVDLEKS